jgi:uncharacterized protein
MNYQMKFRAVNLLLFLLFFAFGLSGQNVEQEDKVSRREVPVYVGLVNDFAGALDGNSRNMLEQKLRNYEDSTSTQIVIVIEKSLEGRAQFERSMDFTRGWKMGSKENNNGVLIYLAMEDKKISIRNSNEVMGRLTGSETDAIIREIMAPEMRSGNVYAALDKATDAVILALAGQFHPGKKNGKDTVPGWAFFLLVFIIISIIGFINNRRFGRGYRGGGAYWFPGSWGGGSWGGGGFGGGGGGSGWGGMGGGGGFDGGGADGGW